MSIFRFPLERVLRVRALEEESARARWSEAEGAARGAESHVQLLRSELVKGRRQLGELRASGAVHANELLAAEHAIGSIERKLTAAHERALTLRFQAEEWREAWREKQVEHEALERLRDRQRTEHAEEENAAESQRLDEVASVRHARRQLPPDPLQFGEGPGR